MKEIIGKRIRKIRENRDYTQGNVAMELELSTGAYAKIERGETDASISKLIRIADILEVNVVDFFVDINQKYGKVSEAMPNYGFATKGDIDELLKMIKTLQQQLDNLKPEIYAKKPTKHAAKKKKK